jgi:hypothetical protein
MPICVFAPEAYCPQCLENGTGIADDLLPSSSCFDYPPWMAKVDESVCSAPLALFKVASVLFSPNSTPVFKSTKTGQGEFGKQPLVGSHSPEGTPCAACPGADSQGKKGQRHI